MVLKFDRNNIDFIEHQLDDLKKHHRYRNLKVVSVETKSRTRARATVDGKRNVLHLCSNDYLGLSHNKMIIKKTILSLKIISQCSSRLVAGNAPKLVELEEKLAQHRGTESSLVYPTGYMANLGVITTLADMNTTILSDELNHASIIDACRLSGANIKVYRHNDTDHLLHLIESLASKKNKFIIVTEGIFSMDGDIPNLKRICDIAKSYRALTIVDDAHGDFIFGDLSIKKFDFSGMSSSCLNPGNDYADVYVSSLSKGLGCFGGYVATNSLIKELLINKSRQFIYTSSLPEHLCVSALTAIPIARRGNLQKKLFENIKFFSSKLEDIGFKLPRSKSQIIPLVIGSERLAMEFSNQLLQKGIFVQAIRYPSVKKGQARLRISLTSLHSIKQLTYVIHSIETIGKKLRII